MMNVLSFEGIECWMSLENIISNRLCTYFTLFSHLIIFICMVLSHSVCTCACACVDSVYMNVESMVISFFRTVHNTSRMIWLMSTNSIEVEVVKFYRHELCNLFCWFYHPSISLSILVRPFIAPPESVSLRHKVYTNLIQCWCGYLSKILVRFAVNSLLRWCVYACTLSEYLPKCV